MPGSKHFPLIAVVVFAVALLAGQTARAQMWLAPAFPTRTLLGPAAARGAVVWSHGRSVDSEDYKAPIPPYMTVLQDGGWDAYRFNRMRRSDALDASAKGLAVQIHELRAKGYREIALTGQSFGGFLALMAADVSDDIDAVIVTAPAAFGSFSDFYDSWRSNATKLYPLIEAVRHARVMMFYFHGDDFDPGGRGDRSREILESRGLSYVVVDQPPRLTSHWAATTPLFVSLYGGCILGFLDAPEVLQGARCEDDTLLAGAPGDRKGQAQASIAPLPSIQGSAR